MEDVAGGWSCEGGCVARSRVERQAGGAWSSWSTPTDEYVSEEEARRREWVAWYDNGGADAEQAGRTAGIVIGVVAMVILILVVPVACICKEKLKQRRRNNVRNQNETTPEIPAHEPTGSHLSGDMDLTLDSILDSSTFPTAADVARMQRMARMRGVRDQEHRAHQDQYGVPESGTRTPYTHGYGSPPASNADTSPVTMDVLSPSHRPPPVEEAPELHDMSPPPYSEAIDSDKYIRTEDLTYGYANRSYARTPSDTGPEEDPGVTFPDEELPPYDPNYGRTMVVSNQPAACTGGEDRDANSEVQIRAGVMHTGMQDGAQEIYRSENRTDFNVSDTSRALGTFGIPVASSSVSTNRPGLQCDRHPTSSHGHELTATPVEDDNVESHHNNPLFNSHGHVISTTPRDQATASSLSMTAVAQQQPNDREILWV